METKISLNTKEEYPVRLRRSARPRRTLTFELTTFELRSLLVMVADFYRKDTEGAIERAQNINTIYDLDPRGHYRWHHVREIYRTLALSLYPETKQYYMVLKKLKRPEINSDEVIFGVGYSIDQLMIRLRERLSLIVVQLKKLQPIYLKSVELRMDYFPLSFVQAHIKSYGYWYAFLKQIEAKMLYDPASWG